MEMLTSILGTNNALTDESIVNDMLMSSKLSASAYLNATLESATPELRAMLNNSLSQIMQAHSAATALAIDHRWYKPYESPEQQLADAYKKSVSSIEYNK